MNTNAERFHEGDEGSGGSSGGGGEDRPVVSTDPVTLDSDKSGGGSAARVLESGDPEVVRGTGHVTEYGRHGGGAGAD